MKPEIEAYLREHGERYTRGALREQLLAAGHPAEEVDAALNEWASQRFQADSDVDEGAQRELRARYWKWTWAIFGVVWLGTVILVGGSYAAVVAVVLGIAMLIGVAISGVIGRLLLRSAGLAALVVPVIAALLLGGSCIGLMGGVGSM